MNEKGLNKIEKFVCEMIWGGIPVDIVWVRESKLFDAGVRKFETGVWDELFEWDKKHFKK